MHRTRNWLIAGAAAAALIGTAAIADAQAVHEMTVNLPGGAVEHIRYTGDVKPELVLLPASAVWGDPFEAAFAQSAFAPDRAFAEFEQISARMDRQMNAIMAQENAIQTAAQSGRYDAAFRNLPRGTVEYTQVSTWTGHGVCTRTTEMSAPGDGARPQMVSNVSGDCGVAAPANTSGAIPAKAEGAPHHPPATHI